MAQLERYYCFCEGQPVGAPLTELEAWLGDGDGRFNGQRCSPEQLEQLLRQIVVEWSEDLLLLLALPERFASVQDSIVKAVNHRRCHTVCILLIFDEEGTPESMPGEFPTDFLSDIKPDSTSFNRQDKRQAKMMLPNRHSKAEFCFLAVPNLGQLLRHWKTIQSTSKAQDLSSFLREASEYLKKPLEMTEMTGLASTVVMFPTLCDGCGSLDTALRAGHLTCLQHLLEGSSYPNRAESEFSPLHLAVLQAGQRKGPQMELYEKMAKLLIFAKHDPGCPNSRGITPLHWAAGYGKAPLVATMLHWTATGLFMRDAASRSLSEEELQLASAAANVQDQNGRTALYRAVMHGHDEVVRWLVLMRADCNIADVHQSTPLHFATHQNREQLVRLLLEHNAQVDQVDADDRLPLHLLAGARKQQGEEQMKILDLLLQNPESVVQNPESVVARDRDGWTPLHEASFAGNRLVLGFLLDRCASGELVTESKSKVPGLLHLAAMGKNVECVELLLKKQASPVQDCCLTWDKDNFQVQHHYVQVGLCLMKTGILPYPFDRIQFDASVSKSSFQRNVSTKMKEFFHDSRKSELKVLNSKDIDPEKCDIIFAEARRFDLRCVSPGEHKDDGSRRPLIVYKHRESALHTRRVLEDMEFWTRVQSRLAELDAGEEHLFRSLSGFQRKVVHQVAASFGLSSESRLQDVAVRKPLEQSEPRRPRAENDVVFLQEVGEDLDKLEPGQEVSLGYGLSCYRRKLVHEEVAKRSWSSRADGPNIVVRHPFPEETPSNDKKQTESEVENWVRKELANLQLGESYSFSPELTSFQRRIVHKVAEDLGWAHESLDVENPDCKVNKKGKASKGKGKGRGKGKGGPRQIIVTRREGEQTSQSTVKDVREEVMDAIQQMATDASLKQYPFGWELESIGMGKRTTIRTMIEKEGHGNYRAETERDGNRLRLVIRRCGKEHGELREELPHGRFECMKVVQEQLNRFVQSKDQEMEYPSSLTKMQRSVVNDTARNFGLASSTAGDQREERRVVVKKSSPDNPSEAPVVHCTYQCDCCEGVPIGVRFHCLHCDDFDLCQSCYEKWTGSNSESPIHPKDHCFEEVAFSVQPQELVMATAITAFHFAAGMGLMDIVQAFLRERDSSSLLGSVTNRGDTALHLACQRQRWQVVNEVLKWNADCNQQNGKGRTALQVVSWLPSYKASDRQELAEMMQLLLSARGDPMIGEKNGDTPLHQADRVAIVFSLIYQNQYSTYSWGSFDFKKCISSFWLSKWEERVIRIHTICV